MRKSIAVDLGLLERYDALLTDLELYLVHQAKHHEPQGFQLLRSIPGIGKVLAMTILYEIHDIRRFDRVQEFASYARLVHCAKESAGKKHGTSGVGCKATTCTADRSQDGVRSRDRTLETRTAARGRGQKEPSTY